MATYLPLGVGPAEMELLLKHGIKYDKRQKRQLLEAYHDQARPILAVLLDYFSARKLKIPQDYLDFLSQHNGGRPEPGSLRLQTQSISIQYFYAYSSPLEACTLDYASTLYQGRIPHGLLPIAHDSSGSLLLLNGSQVDSGHIYYWNHDNEADCTVEACWDNMLKLASSFSELERLLQQSPS